MEYARHLLTETPGRRAIDIGCGAGRNSVPLADLGWKVLGIDLSRPMLEAAQARARTAPARGSLTLALAPMHALPVPDAACDLIVAHGIWNLARSSTEFRAAVREAARAASNEAALFVFTFSRHTLPASAEPVRDETFVFTQFSGQPQCFLTDPSCWPSWRTRASGRTHSSRYANTTGLVRARSSRSADRSSTKPVFAYEESPPGESGDFW
jgi:SAM-dependent methyltransferase